ncbi:MAG: hypothetical protein SOT57_00485, partial [Eubacteriales bacterium]|nr:hypothetical protein [Eubacteriales bacterium]
MMRNKRTLTFLALMLALLLGLTACTAKPVDTPTPSPNAGTTDAPGDASPAPTDDTPAAPANPAATTAQPATDAPTATDATDATDAPTATNTPTATDAPTATNTPTATARADATASAAPATEAAAAPGNPMATGDTPSINVTEESRGLLDGVKVGIDPGHQAHSNSAQEPVSPGSKETKAKVSSGTQGVKTRVPEYEVNLQVALLLRDALEAQGA